MRKSNITLIWLYIAAFLLLYMPNFSYAVGFSGIPVAIIITIILLIHVLVARRNTFFRIMRRKPIVILFFAIILFTVFYAIRTLLAGTSMSDIYNLRIFQHLFPLIPLIGFSCIIAELDNLGFDRHKKYEFIIKVAVVQSLIALSMIVIPAFRQVAYKISGIDNIFITSSRIYGLCDGGYTYSFQIMHSILALFALSYAYFSKKKLYYLSSILILVVTILNGRTGIIVFLTGLAIFIGYILFVEHRLFKFVAIVVGAIVVGSIAWNVLSVKMPSTAKVIASAVQDISRFLDSDSDINISVLADSGNTTGMLISSVLLLEDANPIIGNGYRVYSNLGVQYGYTRGRTDVGFVNDMFMGGIVAMLLLYAPYLYLGDTIRKNNKKGSFERTFIWILLAAVIISNFKGEFFRSMMQVSMLLFIIITMLPLKKETEDEK